MLATRNVQRKMVEVLIAAKANINADNEVKSFAFFRLMLSDSISADTGGGYGQA